LDELVPSESHNGYLIFTLLQQIWSRCHSCALLIFSVGNLVTHRRHWWIHMLHRRAVMKSNRWSWHLQSSVWYYFFADTWKHSINLYHLLLKYTGVIFLVNSINYTVVEGQVLSRRIFLNMLFYLQKLILDTLLKRYR
jgi:hypothetical protein